MPVLSSVRRGRCGGAPARSALAAVALAAAAGLAAAPGDGGGPSVTGRVVDPGGRPVAGARVSLEAMRPGPAALVVERESADPAGARTGDDGWFRASAPSPGHFRLRVEAEDHLPAEVALRPLVDHVGLPEIRLEPEQSGAPPTAAPAPEADCPAFGEAAAGVRGRLTDAVFGTPVAGAVVWLRGCRSWTLSDADGIFELPVHLTAAGGWLEVAASGFLPRSVPVGASAEPAALELQPAATLAGHVVDAAGEPVAGARVVAEPVRAAESDWSPPWPPATVSGPDGGFLLSAIPPETPLRVEAAASERSRGSRSLAGLLAGSPRGSLTLVVDAAPRVSGAVVDATGRPQPGLAVRLRWSNRGAESGLPEIDQAAAAAALTGPGGRFELDPVEPGDYDLVVLRGDEAVLVLPGLALRGAGARIDLGTVRLPPEAFLTGSVGDRRGRPVAGAQIAVRRQEDGPWEAVAMSDERGGFATPPLSGQRAVDLRVEHADFAPEVIASLVPGETPPLEVVLGAGWSVAGRVTDTAGVPLEGARVEARVEGSAASGAGPGPRSVRHLVTDAEGGFEVSRLPAGELTLIASADGHRSARVDGGTISEDRLPPEDVTLELEPAAALAGAVVTTAGEPVAEARVSLREAPRGPPVATLLSGPDGRFELSELTPGPAVLTAEHPRYRTAALQLDLRPGGQNAELVVEEGPALTGRVVEDDDLPVAGALVAVETGGGRTRAVSGADGRFELTGVTPGEHRLVATRDGYSPAEQPVRVPAEGVAEPVLLRLVRGATVAGRLVGVASSELGGVEVAAVGAGGEIVAGRVLAGGGYEIGGLGAGAWRLLARSAAGGQAHETVEVEGGAARIEIDLVLDAGLTLTGSVSAVGRPVPGAEVIVFQPGRGDAVAGTTDRSGRFRLDGLDRGDHLLRVESPTDGLAHQRPLRLDDDLEVGVELEAGELLGRVVDGAAGTPVAGARVDLVPLDAATGAALVTAGTDARGEFRVGLLAHGPYELRVRTADGSGGVLRLDHSASAGATRVEIEVAPLAARPAG